jgi:hypothetical protein
MRRPVLTFSGTGHGSLEVLPESWDDLVTDPAKQPIQQTSGAENAPSRNGWLVEAYRELETGLWFFISVDSAGFEPAYFLAVFKRLEVESDDLVVTEPDAVLDREDTNKQLTVLVADIQGVQQGKMMTRWLRSLVWLHRIEDLPHFLGNTGRYLGSGLAVSVGGRGRPQGGEVRVFVRRPAGGYDELRGEIVKRDPHVMDGVTDDRGNIVAHSGNHSELVNMISGIRIALMNNRLFARGVEFPVGVLKIRDMGYCPLELDLDARQLGVVRSIEISSRFGHNALPSEM